ncbi:MAG TPA: exosortase T, partial [Afifellaceae bacterium]|nr:exosortase T [Afifellaceae bacterium]
SSVLSVDVMAQPWHDLIGLVILGLAVTPVVVWARFPVRAETMPSLQHERPRPRHGLRPDFLSSADFSAGRPGMALAGALVFLAGAAIIGSLPRHAIDVGARDVSVALPDRIDGWPAEPVALTTSEKDYFVRFGGAAAKARYGSASLLVVRTSSPLRHLHTPDDCLRGLGFDVDYLGLGHDPLPTAFYSATSPDGARYRVEVSFVSDSGHAVASVAEATWIWLQQPSTVWTAVQRIMPAEADRPERDDFARGVVAALDLPTGHGPVHHPLTLALNGEDR